MLQINTLKPARGAKRRPKKVGRGNASGHGNYSGHGGKGQTARSGGSKGLALKGFRRLMQSTKKLRGFTSLALRPAEVYLSDLEKHFNAGDTVDIKTLKEKNLINVTAKTVKILTTGDLKKKLTIVGLAATKSAAEKIKAAGGEIE